MNQLERIARLTKSDFARAFMLARSIEGARERIQTLGWVARYAPASEVSRVIAEARKCTSPPSPDAYGPTMALAWPLRACHEVERRDLIAQLMDVALRLSADVRPASSRAEATMLIIHAILPAGLNAAHRAISAVKSLTKETHWRVVRALVDCALLVNGHDQQAAIDVANCISAENKRASTINRLKSGETRQPREFFW